MPFFVKSEGRSHYHLLILILVSIVSRFPFVLKGFGEIDATKIAVSVIDMINNGEDAAFANFYFSDVIPLYIQYLKWWMNALNHRYAYLPLVMNYTNALVGTLVVIPAYLFISRLFRNSAVAFCSVLAFMFAPSFYQSTIMGFPHLIAFFFLLLSLLLYLKAVDDEVNSRAHMLMVLSCAFLTVTFLFKSDYVLASGAFLGVLLMRRTTAPGKYAGAIVIITLSGILFLFFRNVIIGPGGGTTMSTSALSDWYNYSLIIPNTVDYLLRQVKPIAYGAGIVTFFSGIAVVIYYTVKKRIDIVAFILSWCAVPTVFWIVMIGNNARHNMFTVLPVIMVIELFFYERGEKMLMPLTALLILGNFFVTSPSYSILTPSGNLFKSHAMLEDRMDIFRSRAKEIAEIDEEKVAVLGYFHNPHVVFELMQRDPAYRAEKVGREDYRVMTGGREFLFIYFVSARPEDMAREVRYFISKYDMEDYVFSSATYDLGPLARIGLRTKTVGIIQRSTL